MINKILVITDNGFPWYQYNSDENVNEKETYILESAFFTALNQFASEMANEEVRYVVFEQNSYVIKKLPQLLIIFAIKNDHSNTGLDSLEKLINIASGYIQEKLVLEKITNIYSMTEEQLYNFTEKFEQFLNQEKIIENLLPIKIVSIQETFQNLIFKSIGYKPGQCNIGSSERLFRLNLGLQFFVYTLIGYIIIITLHLPQILIILLSIPLFIGFYGLYQFFFKFCVTTALSRKYNMNN